jgi:hypothetical protein
VFPDVEQRLGQSWRAQLTSVVPKWQQDTGHAGAATVLVARYEQRDEFLVAGDQWTARRTSLPMRANMPTSASIVNLSTL